MKRIFAVIVVVLALSPDASAGELRLEAGLDAALSSWDDDQVGHSILQIAYGWTDWAAVHLRTKLGYGSVDERVLSHFGLGGSVFRDVGRARPYVRAELVHQHEEPRAAIEADPIGAAFGVGDGIRHRGGAGAGVGVAVEVGRLRSADIYLVADLGGTILSNDAGPRTYWTGALGIGFDWQLGGGQ